MLATVKKILSILVLCTFTWFVSAQSILDSTASHLILDYSVFDSSEYIIESIGSCRYGRLIRSNQIKNDTITYSYLNTAKFDVSDDRWVGLVSSSIADDIFGSSLNIVTVDSTGKLVNTEITDFGFSFRDFTIYNNNLLVINDADNDFELLTLDGNSRETITAPKQYNYVDQVAGKLFGIYDTGVDILDTAFEISQEAMITHPINSYKVFDDNLYLIGDNSLSVLDTDLSPSLFQTHTTQDSLTDITIINDTLYLLQDESDYTSYISTLDLSNNIEIVAQENKVHYSFQSFVDGSPDGLVYGEQQINSSIGSSESNNHILTNSVVSSINNLNTSNKDCSIEVLDINTYKQERDRFPSGNGDTVILYNYYHEISILITNLDSEIMNDFLMVSNTYGGVNCTQARYDKKYKDLSLSSGASTQIDFEYITYDKIEELCFNVLSVDGEVDIDFSSNQTCSLVSDDQIITTVENTTLYPNPSSDKVYIKTLRNLRKASVYNIDGTKVYMAEISGSNTLSVSTLPAGLYIIKLMDSDKQVSRHKLMVQW